MSERRKKGEWTLQSAAQTQTQAPDRHELERIFETHRNRVFAAAYRITGNSQDSEDVLQTVFMRLARREGGTPLSDSPGAYLHRAAVNAALDVVRSRRHRKSVSLDDLEASPPSTDDPSPEQRQAGSEIKEHIRQALTHLSDNAAEIFVLRYFEGYGNHEIAKMLGTSRSTINVILHRSRKRLQEELSSLRGDAS